MAVIQKPVRSAMKVASAYHPATLGGPVRRRPTIALLSDQSSDSELIAGCLRGDRRAWDRLIDRYRRLVYSIPIHYRMHESDADDVFQAVFLTLYRKLASLKDHEKLSSWLITTTHRECWRLGRDRNRELDLQHDFADVSSPSDDRIATIERQQLVREALRELGGPCELLLKALFLASSNPDYEQIAERLNMKVGSIGPTRARCFRKLERILIRMGLDEASDG